MGCGPKSNRLEVLQGLGNRTEFRYIAFDHTLCFDKPLDPEAGPDFIADASFIPLPNSFASTVICTELLEHVTDDFSVLKEISRILKCGGLFILTLPGRDIPKHEKLPFQIDYRRYSVAGRSRASRTWIYRDPDERSLLGRFPN